MIFENLVDKWGLPLLLEDFKTAEMKFLAQGAEEEAVKKTISAFKSVKDRITDPKERDIDQWAKKSFEEFKEFVEKLASTKSKNAEKKLAKMEGAELVAENAGWLVYKIHSHEACLSYGSGTQWCITQKDGRYWKQYSGSQFYFLISKTKDESDEWYKIAVQVERTGKVTYWDATDTRHDSLPDELGVPEFKKEAKPRPEKGTVSAEEMKELYGEEISNLADERVQYQVASYFDEGSYGYLTTSDQDLRLPYHIELPEIDRWKKSTSALALKRLIEFVPAVERFVNAYLSWSNSGGMMPFSDANYPDDAVIVAIEGIDSETEDEIEVYDLMRLLDVSEDDEEAFREFLVEYGDRYGVRFHRIDDDYVYFSGRHQTVHAIYFKSQEIADLVEQEAKNLDPETLAQARELVKEIQENAGTYK